MEFGWRPVKHFLNWESGLLPSVFRNSFLQLHCQVLLITCSSTYFPKQHHENNWGQHCAENNSEHGETTKGHRGKVRQLPSKKIHTSNNNPSWFLTEADWKWSSSVKLVQSVNLSVARQRDLLRPPSAPRQLHCSAASACRPIGPHRPGTRLSHHDEDIYILSIWLTLISRVIYSQEDLRAEADLVWVTGRLCFYDLSCGSLCAFMLCVRCYQTSGEKLQFSHSVIHFWNTLYLWSELINLETEH